MPATPAALDAPQARRLCALGERLRKARLRRHLSAAEVAARAGITRVTLHRAEAGQPAIAIGNLVKVLAILGLDEDLEGVAADAALKRSTPDETLRPRRERRIRIADYPQLRQIAWHLAPDSQVSPQEALSLYERNWRHVDADMLDAKERRLIAQLTATIGQGVFLV